MNTEKYVECPLMEATKIKLGAKEYQKGSEFVINGQCLSIRIDFDRWQDLHVNDLDLFGIVPMRLLRLEETFKTVSKVLPRGNHAVVVIELPSDYNSFIYRDIECVLKFKGDL